MGESLEKVYLLAFGLDKVKAMTGLVAVSYTHLTLPTIYSV